MIIPDFANKLEALLKERGLSQVALANMADMAPRYISKVKTCNGEIPESFIKRICKALNITQDYFFEKNTFQSNHYFPVPLRDTIGGMGGGSFSGSKKIESYVSLRKDFLLTKTCSLDALSFIHASGESMYPTIPPDAIVLIDESQREPINKKIFYVMLNDVFLIKRLEVKNGKVCALISDNGELREEIGEQDHLEILGKALLQQTLL